jgi:hypothetical protein
MSSEQKNEYSAIISNGIYYSSYDWCGNNYDGDRSGTYLSINAEKNFSTKKGNTFVAEILIKMNDTLFENTDIIHFYDDNDNFRYQSKSISSTKYREAFTIDDIDSFKSLTVKFLKISGTTGKLLPRATFETIYADTVQINHIKIREYEECSICFDEIKENDIYVGKCNHIFHLKCIYSYLEKSGRLCELSRRCKEWCKHSKKPISFECPMCRTVLENCYYDKVEKNEQNENDENNESEESVESEYSEESE